MENTNFNELALKAYESAKARGFHKEKHSDGHYIMLVACELAEAIEADRKNSRADRRTYNFLLQEYGEVVERHLFEMHIKDTLEDELADAVIRLLNYSGMKGISIPEGYITEKTIKSALDNTFNANEWKGLKTFAEKVFVAVGANICLAIETPESTMFSIFVIAEHYGIDLLWFIHEKMRYNENREYLHGKQY